MGMISQAKTGKLGSTQDANPNHENRIEAKRKLWNGSKNILVSF